MRIPAGLSSYQVRCIRERLAEGYEIVGYGRLDGGETPYALITQVVQATEEWERIEFAPGEGSDA